MHALGRFATAAAVAAAALLCATGNARAQSSSDIHFELGQAVAFQVRLAISPGTDQVYCYQSDRLRVIGSTTNTASSTVSVPIVVPDPVIRCSACNAWGCSSLSPNSAVVTPSHPLDIDQNEVVDVRDMSMCVSRIRDYIF